jgi:hypothetical protein
MVKKNNYIAIQNGCNNILYNYEEDENGEDGDVMEVFNTEAKVTKMVEENVREDTHNYDSSEGDVVIYELVPVKIAKTPSSVIWSKAA